MQLESFASFRAPQRALFSPTVVVDCMDVQGKELFVVRDDLLPGGTKQRACAPFLESLAERGYDRFYYASPFAGFAQVALAYVCQHLDLEWHIYSSIDPNATTRAGRKHEFTALAESYGAKVTLVETLAEGERLATGASRLVGGAYKIPLGFDCLDFRESLESELREQWQTVVASIGETPKRLWIPVGSGTLASVFKKIVSSETKLHCVDVRVLKPEDLRIASLANDSTLMYLRAAEAFHEYPNVAAPIPSNRHYDAKLWRVFKEGAESGDVWWNVAR